MAAKKDELAAVTKIAEPDTTVTKVQVFLPPHEDDNSGVKVDQYEHVTINGVTTLIKRGEYVEIPVPVYIQLKNKFPGI
ncbi:MAG: hypothetical protein IJ130_01345 [Solobacterium sp.]|nr:hypothetical protein [Solobacterium sp.]